MDFGQEPGLLSEPTLLSSPTPLDAFGPPVAKPARRAADLSDPEEDLDAEAGPQKAAKSRRRMGWRKGSDIDEEMWPAEAFGGLSDDQFWDDLASDKPLTTTARSAHQDAGTRRDFDQAKDQLTDAAARPADGPARPAARGNGRRPAHGAAHTPGHPGTRPRPTVPPVPQASPIPSASQPNQLQPTHLQATTQLQPIRSQPATQLLATQPTIPAKQQAATQPVASARPFPAGSSQPMRTTTGPNETRGRRQGGAGDDPLTSTAFSLRASGPVDGWSNQAPSGARETGWDQYNAAVSQGTETQAFGAVDTPADNGGYPLPPYRPSGPPPGAGHAQAQRPSWPREGSADPYAPAPSAYPGRPASEQRPYGEGQPYARRAPYGNAPADEPRRPNGAGARTQPPRPGYQGPGEDRRRPRDPQNPQNPRDGYRR